VPEHCEVIKRCVDYVAGRLPIVAGTGSNSTAEAIELSQSAAEAGADACLLVTPYYNRPTQRGLYQHFRALAEAVAVPQILYNVPARTGVDMDNDTTLALAEIDNIVGTKDATGDLERGRDLIRRAPPGFAIYSGDDPTAMELMLAGGHGNISVTANVAPHTMAQLCQVAIAGDRSGAQEINAQLSALNTALGLEVNPIPVKWALHLQGRIAEGIRLPMTPLDVACRPQLEAALAALPEQS
jgi:4-hydroxy-tetrahydrodipicolinate synthase